MPERSRAIHTCLSKAYSSHVNLLLTHTIWTKLLEEIIKHLCFPGMAYVLLPLVVSDVQKCYSPTENFLCAQAKGKALWIQLKVPFSF